MSTLKEIGHSSSEDSKVLVLNKIATPTMIPVNQVQFLLLLPMLLNWYIPTAFALNSKASNLTFNEQIFCEHTPTPKPDPADCENAISEFPIDDITSHHIFHTGIREDEYRLPVSHSSGTCKVVVSLAPWVAREVGSWWRIDFLAGQIAVKCLLQGTTAGFALAGDSESIRIDLSYNAATESDNNAGIISEA